MPSVCPTSARLSLPNVLKTLFNSEFPTQLRNSKPLNRAHQGFGRARPITTVPMSSVPITSSSPLPPQPQPEVSSHPESTASENLKARPKRSTNETPAQSKANKISRSSQTKSKPKTLSGKQSADRNAEKAGKKAGKKVETDSSSEQKKKREAWEIQKEALKKKFPDGWSPTKKLSPDAIEGLRHLHSMAPDQFTTAVLAKEFKISPEAIRRILKSKWRPSTTELEDRRQRWERREERIWSHMSELGLRPHRKSTEPVSDAVKLLYKKPRGKASPSDMPAE